MYIKVIFLKKNLKEELAMLNSVELSHKHRTEEVPAVESKVTMRLGLRTALKSFQFSDVIFMWLLINAPFQAN